MIQCSSMWTLIFCPMSPYPWQPGFLTLCPADIWGQVILCWGRGGCILCIEGYLAAPLVSTHQMPAVTPSPVATIPNHCQMSPVGQNHLQLRTTDVKQSSGTMRCVLLKENLIYINLQKTQARRGLFHAQLARKKAVPYSEVHPGQSHEKTIAGD